MTKPTVIFFGPDGPGRELNKIFEAGAISGKHREMITRFALRSRILFESAARRYIRLVANDRVDARRSACGVELKRTIEVTVVGNCQGIHSQFFSPRDQFIDRAGPVQQTVMAMAMQMSKWRRRHRWFPSLASRGVLAPELDCLAVILSCCACTRHEAAAV